MLKRHNGTDNFYFVHAFKNKIHGIYVTCAVHNNVITTLTIPYNMFILHYTMLSKGFRTVCQ